MIPNSKIMARTPGGGNRFENDGMCRPKSAFPIWTLTVQRKFGKNHTLTAHFVSNFPLLFQNFIPLQCIFPFPTLTVHFQDLEKPTLKCGTCCKSDHMSAPPGQEHHVFVPLTGTQFLFGEDIVPL